MPNAATTRIRRSTKAFTVKRDARLRAVDAPLTRWLTGVERELAGIMATHSGTARQLEQKLVPVLDDVQTDGAAEMEKLLRRTWHWGWDTATADFIAVYPMEYWVRRHLPLNRMAVTEEFLPATDEAIDNLLEDAYHAATDAGIDRILSGEATEEEAREIVRQLEFAPPSEDFVTTVLNETVADDGMSAMKRIVTVTETDKRSLLDTLVTGFSEGLNIAKMTPAIRQYVGNVHYKAARIARTEGVRVAQAGLDKTWDEAGDIVEGMQWFSALLPQTRPDHAELDQKIYHKTSGGYIADDGSSLPRNPLGPNCLCWTSPVLPDFDSLIPGLPKVDLGEPYETGRKRAIDQGVGADLDDYKAKRAARKAATKRKPKAVPKPKPRKAVKPKAVVKPKPTPKPKPKPKPAPKAAPKPTPKPAPKPVETIAKAETKIVGQKNETAVVFDKNGNEVFRKTGTSNAVEFTASEAERMRGSTLTHNHPPVSSKESRAVIHNLPLSGADGVLMANQKMAEVRAVTRDFTFSIKPKPGGLPIDAKKLNAAWRRRENVHFRKETSRLSELVRKGDITRHQANERGFLYEQESQHKAWLDIADKHGVEYKREARDG